MKSLRRWAHDVAEGVKRMAVQDVAGMHQALVDDLVKRRLIKSRTVERAFRAVPRHPFLPGVALELIYKDEPVVTHYNMDKQPISSSSQPAIMAIMLEMLALEPGQRVLEIGAGTGYNAALMTQIVGESGKVVAVDIDPDVIHEADAHLRAAGIDGVTLVLGDGALGCEAFAPYDRIILTVGATDIAPAWRDQLVEGGLLVLPLSLRAAPRVFAFRRQGDFLPGVEVTMGGFMPLRGLSAPDEHSYALPRMGGALWMDGAIALDPARVDATMEQSYRDLPTGVTSDYTGTWSGYALWLELHAAHFIHAPIRVEAEGRKTLTQTCGLASEDGQVALVVPERGGRALVVRQFGESEMLAARLVAHLRDWQAAGSPDFDEDVQVSAYPLDVAIKAPPGSLRVAKGHMQYIVTLKELFV
jgi:protein-L-isoaspartate(D-aspartate) O-methyltransferase